MRLISFMLTEAQIRARTKTQTRRLGWHHVRVGDRLRGVLKCQGRTRRCRACDGAGYVWGEVRRSVAGFQSGGTRPCAECRASGKTTDPLVDLAVVEVTAVRREPVGDITQADVIVEGAALGRREG